MKRRKMVAILDKKINCILLGAVFLLSFGSYVNAETVNVPIDVLVSGLENDETVTLSEEVKDVDSQALGNGSHFGVFKNYRVSDEDSDDYFDITATFNKDGHSGENKVCHVALGSYTSNDEDTKMAPKNLGDTYVHHLPMVICRKEGEENFAENGSSGVGKATYAYYKKYMVYYPKDASKNNKRPLIVFGNAALSKISDYEKAINILVSRGFIVIGRDVNPELPTNLFGQAKPNYIMGEDLIGAYDTFKNRPQWFELVDEDKIGVVGASMGGGGAFALMVKYAEIKTAVLLDPCFVEDYDMENAEIEGVGSTLIIDNTGNTERYCPEAHVDRLYHAIARNLIPVARIQLPGEMDEENYDPAETIVYDHPSAIVSGLYHTVAWLELQFMDNDSAGRIFYEDDDGDLITPPELDNHSTWIYTDDCLWPDSNGCTEYLNSLD